ncbi:MAG: cellulase family glycosylhydrolase [Candidatus Marinimicrobia bacterium]|nr:cellulase family glycosylhydrolase [Candidatus Neomarinimicrobiota bacterium]
MKKLSIILICFMLLFTFCNQRNKTEFVRVKGDHFILENKSYNYLGTNLWYGPLLGMATEPGNRTRLKRELDSLKSIGLTNLRIMAASEGTIYDNTVRPAFQPELGKYNEDVLIGLDYLLAELNKRDLKAVLYLGNNWVWSGGFAQYVAWVNNDTMPNPFLPEYDWNDFMNYSARFYSNQEAVEAYNKYVKMLVNRKNTITGQLYKDDPAIMSWQLANEPRPGRGDEGQDNFDAFSSWVENTVKMIKSMDSNHLVSTGNEGLAGSMQSKELYKRIHQFNNIDYMTVHLWVLNWGWFDPQKSEQTFPDAREKAKNYIQKHIKYAKDLNKPLVLSEFGIPRDNHSYSPESSTNFRDEYYAMIFEMIYENARNGDPLVGSNFWAWGGGWKPAGAKKYIWEPGDPFCGDPPQEPQGRNSVFISDQSTIRILREYTDKMTKLNIKAK